jgi:hypothetical protein
MIWVTKNFLDISGKWFDFKTREGVIIQLKIRPLFLDLCPIIESRHKKISSFKKHKSKIIKKTKINFETLSDDVVDYILEDFCGIGSAPDTPLQPTAENKMKVIIHIDAGDFIMERASALAKERAKEVIRFEVTEGNNLNA